MKPAVHYNENKKANVTFWYKGKYTRITLNTKDRQTALSHVKAYYSGATKISVVFFIPHTDISAK